MKIIYESFLLEDVKINNKDFFFEDFAKECIKYLQRNLNTIIGRSDQKLVSFVQLSEFFHMDEQEYYSEQHGGDLKGFDPEKEQWDINVYKFSYYTPLGGPTNKNSVFIIDFDDYEEESGLFVTHVERDEGCVDLIKRFITSRKKGLEKSGFKIADKEIKELYDDNVPDVSRLTDKTEGKYDLPEFDVSDKFVSPQQIIKALQGMPGAFYNEEQREKIKKLGLVKNDSEFDITYIGRKDRKGDGGKDDLSFYPWHLTTYIFKIPQFDAKKFGSTLFLVSYFANNVKDHWWTMRQRDGVSPQEAEKIQFGEIEEDDIPTYDTFKEMLVDWSETWGLFPEKNVDNLIKFAVIWLKKKGKLDKDFEF